ncbi:cytosolic non-specific dipeptidase-like protein [Leptotrombidium deliense]|uniref:Cytosolic non-specific dipeptidase-like protein n=1 Tax=Leptotrombidium deliense TaxID=299467 RepID=A0A443SN31_9ACAR|nr:cytosolic non-specific dipeptidase-like protein [Leptotrombidium deliense]
MSSESLLNKIFEFVDQNEEKYISLLREAVAIKSVSASKCDREEVVRMIHWFADKLKAENASVEFADIGEQTFSDGDKLPLPPVLLGDLGTDPKKKTVLVYGHLDVQPASKSDGWDTEPFELTEIDGKLYGRGATDDKGPVLCWLNAINAFHTLGIELPVNIKFCFEGMEESGSEGLDDLVESKKDTFFKNTDYVCISDNYWLGLNKPCITYGLRGLSYFGIEVECACKDLHSGVYGGTVHEAMFDLAALLSSLVDENGKILIPGIMDDVKPVTEEERKLYEPIDFDCSVYRDEIGCNQLRQQKKEDILMSRWRYPSLSIHGIEGAFSEPGAKTVIPKKVIGKFSIRLVPDQHPAKIEKLVIDYLNAQFAKRKSPNSMRAFMYSGGRPWLADVNHHNFRSAQRAIKQVFDVEPDFIREGGSIPVTLTFEEVLQKSVMLLPIGAADDGAHSQNEKIDRRNYINGIKVLAAYLVEVAK